jgi:hypothetical protein
MRVKILIFCFLLSTRHDREELDPKLLFVELQKRIHNQFPGAGDACVKWLAPSWWKASESGRKEDDKPTSTESKYQL